MYVGFKPVVLLATAMAIFSATVARAQDSAMEPKPVVLILLDTSGSMEYGADGVLAETGDDDVLTVPVCNGIGDSGKSRYILATEVLTGSFADYYCTIKDRSNIAVSPCPREDCPYVVPHVVAHGTQADDGLLDRGRQDFKFGVMTFDTVASIATDSTGGYSYGDETPENYGAKNDTALYGPFVEPSSFDDSADVISRNADVQNAILSALPFGGTPLSPLLYDALYWFQNDTDIVDDPYADCRERSVVLITDGRASIGEGVSPYLDSVAQAQALRAEGVNVYVIGFQLAQGVDTMARNIATNNGVLDEDDYYFEAIDSYDLAQALSKILGDSAVATQSRTRTVITSETGNTTDVQYQFNAAHANVRDLDGTGWITGIRQGILERSVYRCGLEPDQPDVATLGEIQRISDVLNAREPSTRYIYTVVSGNLEEFIESNPHLTDSDLGISTSASNYPNFSRDATTGQSKTGFIPLPPGLARLEFRENLFAFVRAENDSCRTGVAMGAIDHSTPVIQGRLGDDDIAIPSFAQYKSSIVDRPIMLYVSTNEGMIHAFRIDREDTSTEPAHWGREEWAYIPRHQLDRLAELPQGERTLLDGSPVLADIILNRDRTLLSTEGEDSWRSILVFGERAGGRGITALDVTDPSNGNWDFLWEVSAEDGRCVGGQTNCNHDGSTAENDFSRLGYTYSSPVIGKVQMCPGGMSVCNQADYEEVAVAVFGGGSQGGLGGDIGRTVYVVRLDNGKIIKEFNNGSSAVSSDCTGTVGNAIDADMIGSPNCYSTATGTFLTRCYMGDSAGRLWRLEIGSQFISEWNLSLFYDPYDEPSRFGTLALDDPARGPLIERPSIALRSYQNQIVVVFGTGDPDSLDDLDEKNVVVSLSESIQSGTLDLGDACSPWSLPRSGCFQTYSFSGLNKHVGPIVNWKRFLGYDSGLNQYPDPGDAVAYPGERMMGPSVLYSSVAYFVTFNPDDDQPCNPGLGGIWGVSYVTTDSDCMDPTPKLPAPLSPTNLIAKSTIGNGTTGAIPYGLTIVSRPACYAGVSIGDSFSGGVSSGANFSSQSSGTPQLIVQTGLQSETPTETPGAGSQSRTTNIASRNILQAVQSLLVSAWGLIFD